MRGASRWPTWRLTVNHLGRVPRDENPGGGRNGRRLVDSTAAPALLGCAREAEQAGRRRTVELERELVPVEDETQRPRVDAGDLVVFDDKGVVFPPFTASPAP